MNKMNERGRKQLIEKIEGLASVVYSALKKVESAAQRPGADVERLNGIADHLRTTLKNCGKSLDALLKQDNMTASGVLGPITPEEIQSIDWKALEGEI
jgi:hypothetical protein